MAFIIINHKVNDFNSWKKMYDLNTEGREMVGIKEIKVGGTNEDPNDVFIIFETETPDLFYAMFNDAEAIQALKEYGVISTPILTIIP